MKPKIIMATILAALLALGLCACSQGGSSTPSKSDASQETASQYKTMADVFAVESSDTSWAYNEKQFKYVFSDDTSYTSIVVDLPEGMKEKLDEADFDDAKIRELLGPLPVTKQETFETPAQDKLDELVGKTGAELVDDDFIITMLTVNGDKTDANMHKDPFDYLITFDGAVEDENTEDPVGAIKDLKVDSVAVQGIDIELSDNPAE